MRLAFAAALLLGAGACVSSAPSDAPQPGSGVVDLALPDGGVQRVLYLQPPGRPAAVVVPLVGGDGWLLIDGAGQTTAPSFLVTHRDDWLAQGLGVAYLRAAEPQYGRRIGDAAARPLATVVAYIRTRTDAPIWLVGHSNGSAAAVNGAAHLTHGEIAGLVLLGSTTRFFPGGAPDTVFTAGLDRVTVPTLIISHADDPCRPTPPADAPVIQAALTHAPKTEVMIVTGGTASATNTTTCGGTPHSFEGMQPQVIERVCNWIIAQSQH